MTDPACYLETANETDRLRGRWKEPRRVLGVLASPRGERGATGKVYAALVAGMEQAGTAIETVALTDLAPQPCSGCFRCWLRGGRRCVIQDPMTEFAETIPSYDLLVLATPVYVDGMTGPAKNFVDRLMPLNHPSIGEHAGRLIHPSRHARMPDLALLAVCGLPGTENFGPLLAHVASVATHLHTPLAAALLRPETVSFRHPKAASRVADTLAATRAAGTALIRTGAVPDALQERIRQPLLDPEAFLELASAWWK